MTGSSGQLLPGLWLSVNYQEFTAKIILSAQPQASSVWFHYLHVITNKGLKLQVMHKHFDNLN